MESLQQLLWTLFETVFGYVGDAWRWWLSQILAVPWGQLGSLPGSKVLLLTASAALVGYFLFRAATELFEAGGKAFSALLTLFRVFVKTMPPVLFAGVAAAAGAWIVNHIQL